MKIVLTPNPYRDKQFRTVQQAKKILESCGVETVMCLPFDVDRNTSTRRTPRSIRGYSGDFCPLSYYKDHNTDFAVKLYTAAVGQDVIEIVSWS